MKKNNNKILLKSLSAVIALSAFMTMMQSHTVSAAGESKKSAPVDGATKAQPAQPAKGQKIFDERIVTHHMVIDSDKGTVDFEKLAKFAMTETDRPYVEVSEKPLKEAIDTLKPFQKDIAIAVRHEDQVLPSMLVGKIITNPDNGTMRLSGLTGEDLAEIQRVKEVFDRAPEGPISINMMVLPRGGWDWYFHGGEGVVSTHPTVAGQYRITFDKLDNGAIYALAGGDPTLKAVDPAEFSKNWTVGNGSIKSYASMNPNFIMVGRGEDGQLLSIKGKLKSVDAAGLVFDFEPLPGTPVPALGTIYKAASWIDFGGGVPGVG